METIQARTREGSGANIPIDKSPDTCPVCHAGIEPKDHGLAYYAKAAERVERALGCTRENCQHLFLAVYRRAPNSALYVFNQSVPFNPVDLEFSEIVKTISPSYAEIANQAHKAEGMGWGAVSGPGYRKALEFLIKDYLCSKATTDEEKETIKKMELGNCIANRVKNENIKDMAARAAWLGNDETHYVRKWDGKDIGDLKMLIDIAVKWIELEELTIQLRAEMPKKV